MSLAQFLEPPAAIKRTEVSIIERLFSLPGKVLSRSMVAHQASLFKMSSPLPSASCWAALARATMHTFKDLRPDAVSLDRVAESNLSFAKYCEGFRSPPWWNSPSIVSRLTGGEPGPRSQDSQVFHVALGAARRALADPFEKVQRSAYAAWVERRFPALALTRDLERRFSLLVDPLVAQFLSVQWASLARHSKPHTVQCAARTFLNGWCCQHRLHTDDHDDCLFGCPDGRNSLQAHYFKNVRACLRRCSLLGGLAFHLLR